MNHKFLISFVIVSVLLFESTGAIAQVTGLSAPQTSLGTAFTYQGQLKQNGAAVNASCDMVFCLYDTPGGGAQVGNASTAR